MTKRGTGACSSGTRERTMRKLVAAASPLSPSDRHLRRIVSHAQGDGDSSLLERRLNQAAYFEALEAGKASAFSARQDPGQPLRGSAPDCIGGQPARRRSVAGNGI